MDSKHALQKGRLASLVGASKALATLEKAIGPLPTSFDEEAAERMFALADEMTELPSTEELGPLLGYVMSWLKSYEDQGPEIHDVGPVELLKHLMDSNGLRQRDLAEELGGQPVVSAILSGGRKINLRQAKSLAARFGIAFTAFLDPESDAKVVSNVEAADDGVFNVCVLNAQDLRLETLEYRNVRHQH